MQPLADAACELPWLAPCADSLVALARGPGAKTWSELRSDPGLVLLLLRAAGPGGASALPYYSSLLRDPFTVSLALDRLAQRPLGFIAWTAPLAPLYRAAQILAKTAEAIAQRSDRSDPEHAFVGGMLAPLGWLVAAAADPKATQTALAELPAQDSATKLQVALWGLDAQALARRLAIPWMLPAWLTAIVGHLALPVEVAATLGADPERFQVVQLAVHLVEQAGLGLKLPVAGNRAELASALDLSSAALQKIREEIPRFANAAAVPASWSSPLDVPLLPDLLRLALENRRLQGKAGKDPLHVNVDALHDALARQKTTEATRLHENKLRAMAELAAGAGHEINNPLAVISGQAQYLLTGEHETPRRKALQTIIGQAQRIHQVLTGLMQFARPPVPQRQSVDLDGLVREVLGSVQALADERQVAVQAPSTLPPLTLDVDPGQMRTMLVALVRNAVEAAPPAGWVRVTVDYRADGHLHFAVEDSGLGPTALDREHLFDPFYSGRKAGRGRGLGLPTAWQLARQHNADLQIDGEGPTRFLLVLPPEAICSALRNGVHPPTPAEAYHDGALALSSCPAFPVSSATDPGLVLLAPGGNGIPAHG